MKITKKVSTLIAFATLAVFALVAAPANATDDSLAGWYTWETTYVGANDPTASTITWPQTLVGKGKSAPECGVWYQQDRYDGKNKDIEKVIKDGVLVMTKDGPEDRHIVKEWTFEYGGDCTQDPRVEYGEWVDGTFECGDTTVTTSRTVTTTVYTWNRATASFDSNTTTTTENSTRDLTGDEVFPCDEFGQGEEVDAVSECTGPGIATITTTARSWTSINGERTYGEAITYTEQVGDAACIDDDDNPAPPATPVPSDEVTFTG